MDDSCGYWTCIHYLNECDVRARVRMVLSKVYCGLWTSDKGQRRQVDSVGVEQGSRWCVELIEQDPQNLKLMSGLC